MPTATVTSKGQVTIPVEVGTRWASGPDRGVSFLLTDTGAYELVPETRTIKSLKGIFARPAKPVPLDQMEKAVMDGAVESLGR